MGRSTRLICGVVLIAMAAYWVAGFLWGGGMDAVKASFVPFWGRFVWTDITALFVLVATIVTAYERSVAKGLAMFVAMNLFGSVAVAAWLLWRGPGFYHALSRREHPPQE